jgi:hypothetical protein
MKKLLLKCVIMIGLVSIFTSCEKNTTEDCETCKTEDFAIVKSKIEGENFEFKEFINNEGNFNFLFNKFNNSNFNSIVNLLEFKTITNLNAKDLVGFCLITNKRKIINENFEIDKTDLKGLITYTTDSNKNITFRIFNFDNGNFKENSFSQFNIGYITTNEIEDVTNLFFNGENNTTFLITNSLYQMLPDVSNKYISTKLKKLLNQKYLNKVEDAPKTCGRGCTFNDGYPCALYNNNKFSCKEDPNGTCPEQDAKNRLISWNNFDFDLEKITSDLYYFRSDYLLEINGGQNLIKDYYELGTSLPASFYTYENCVELFEILQNDITPKTNELVKNPLSDTVLIDNVLNNKVKNYLLKIKEFYSSQSDKDKAQKLITKLDFFTNKSNKFITNNLYLY